jgi:hypothetical protein
MLLLAAATLAVAEGGKEAPGVTQGAAAAAASQGSPLLAEMAKRG